MIDVFTKMVSFINIKKERYFLKTVPGLDWAIEVLVYVSAGVSVVFAPSFLLKQLQQPGSPLQSPSICSTVSSIIDRSAAFTLIQTPDP